MAQDRVRRLIRILVVLMFAELVVVILLVDLRLDSVETELAHSRRHARSGPPGALDLSRPRERPRRDVRRHAAAFDVEGDVALRGAEEDPPQMAPAPRRLTDDDRQEVIEELYRAERVWRRTAGVLHGLAALRAKGLLRELGEAERDRVVKVTRDYVGKRVHIEFAVMMAEDVPAMDRIRAELQRFDRNEADRIEEELSSFVNPAEAKQLTRLVVPRGSS